MSTTRGPCPHCNRGPKDTALAITTDERGTVEYCHRCQYTKADNVERAGIALPPRQSGNRWSDLAQSIWDRSTHLRGSLAQTYLERRRCVLPPPDGDVRFLPATNRHPAAMLARITDAVTNEPLSLHFTKLHPDGTKIERRMLAGHVKRGGVIRLWADHDVAYGLGIAEGIETALSAAHAFRPMWSCIDAGNLACLPVLPGIEALSIYADNDAAGIDAAQQCARRWLSAGRDVAVYTPDVAGDVNDILQEVA
jgi:hypothetical protein